MRAESPRLARLFLFAFVVAARFDAVASAAKPPALVSPGAGLVRRIDAALARSSRFFLRTQSPDGAWRSATYGAFRDGPSLTPLVLSSLFFLPQGGTGVRPAFRRGRGYLVAMVGADGRIAEGPRGLNFPALTAAMTSRIVMLENKDALLRRAQRAWLTYLRARQLNEALGWSPADREYGGWGFALGVPKKPAKGEPPGRFVESNMVATLFGIAALRSAKVPAADPAYRQALIFVKRCQNFPDEPRRADPRFDDGGFFFIPGDRLQNKAGVAGTDRFGRTRFHSYGTMTADGLRALLRCGLPADHPRVAAARKWLEGHFTVRTNPGHFAPEREVLRGATYYYYCWAVAHAFLALRVREVQTKDGRVNWTEALAEELLRRQRPDGTWVNRYTDAREDDPLVATPWAASALAICRAVVVGRPRSLGPACSKRARRAAPLVTSAAAGG